MMMFSARTIATNRELALGSALKKRMAQTAILPDTLPTPDNSGTKEDRVVLVLV